MKSFTVIDFETATPKRNSACALGLVRFENLEIIAKDYFLIQPPNNEYNYFNIGIHGITPDETKNALQFDKIWPRIKHFFDDQLIVGHNVSFDISVLRNTLLFHEIDFPRIESFCTYQLTGLKLNLACKKHNIDLIHHHALSDAIASSKLYLLFLDSKIGFDESSQSKLITTKSTSRTTSGIDSKLLIQKKEVADCENIFFKKKIIISGVFMNYSRKELATLLWEKGAKINTSISSKTNYILAGENMGPSKKQKAEKLGIPIISESEFEEMIGG